MASHAGKTYQLGPCYQTVVALTRSRTTTSVIPAQAGTHGPDCLPSHNRKTHQPVRLTKKEVAPRNRATTPSFHETPNPGTPGLESGDEAKTCPPTPQATGKARSSSPPRQ